MTTTMREVPGQYFDSFHSGTAESKQAGTEHGIGGDLGGGNDHELARVALTTRIRAAGMTTAAGTSAQG